MNSVEIHMSKSIETYDAKVGNKSLSDFLKNSLNYLKKNNINDKTTTYTKTLNKKTNQPFEITIKSLNITFQLNNKDSNHKQIVYDFYLPFDFLPVFYSLDFKSFVKLYSFK